MRLTMLIIWLITLTSCNNKRSVEPGTEMLQLKNEVTNDTIVKPPVAASTFPAGSQHINTGSTTPEELLAFAQSLIGTAYSYASVDPAVGFDCSGFLTYVFNHFHIAVPRSSIDYSNVERKIDLADAKPGDLVLFTGTDSTNRLAGHIGIITSNEKGKCYFIHSTSGKAKGVTITELSAYYFFRFIKVIRIFPQNDL
ncbi:MAG: C40 family peptidase [Chitinophagaceae bacterium]|nr:C40 family peptidase [Chitinophagaceae bacterium]